MLALRYSVEHLIGEGTFGWVVSALDLGSTPARRVAIKVLKDQHAAHDKVVRRFERRELELLRRVQEHHPSPHVVRALVPKLLSHGGLPYLVLEHIDGPTLRERLDGDPLEPSEIRRLGIGIARGLAAIHAAGGVHRDLKPTNIRLRDGSEPVIVDLGITLALWETQEFTATGQAPMTPRYASPEQLRGQDVSPASDIYSLGVLLHEVLTGELPEGANGLLPLGGVRRARPIPPELMKCVQRCLARDPRRRPTALGVAAMLAAPPRASPLSRALRWSMCVGAALLVLTRLAIERPQTTPPLVPPPPPPWSDSLGDATGVRWMYAVPDSTGGMLVAGSFQKTLDLGNTLLTSAGQEDVFLARIDSDGQVLWSRRGGDAGWQGVFGAAVSPDGNLCITGSFDGVLDLGGQPMTNFGGRDTYVACLDRKGRLLWSKSFGDLSDQHGLAIAIDAAGNVTMAGVFYGSVDFGNGALVSAGLSDVFLARFTPDGRLLWSQRFGDSELQFPTGLTVDSRGNILLSGVFEGTIDLGGKPLNSAGLRDGFIAMFDVDGRHLWSKRRGDAGEQKGEVAVFDGEDHIVIVEGEGSQADGFVLHVHRLAPDGTTLWSRSIGPFEHLPSEFGIDHELDGRLVLAGSIPGIQGLGDGHISELGGMDLFVVELSREGTLIESRRFGDTANLAAHSVKRDRWGNITLTGVFEGRRFRDPPAQ